MDGWTDRSNQSQSKYSLLRLVLYAVCVIAAIQFTGRNVAVRLLSSLPPDRRPRARLLRSGHHHRSTCRPSVQECVCNCSDRLPSEPKNKTTTEFRFAHSHQSVTLSNVRYWDCRTVVHGIETHTLQALLLLLLLLFTASLFISRPIFFYFVASLISVRGNRAKCVVD